MKHLFIFLTLLCWSTFMYSQTQTVKGNVKDANTSEVLPGVNVAVKGTTVGTTTDNKGNFTLQVPTGTKNLVFSYIGFHITELPVQSNMEVHLESSMEKIDEVVVVAYGTELAKNLTGSVGNVKSGALKRAAEISPIKGLAGNTSGVRVSIGDGEPGSSVSIQVRGVNSINGSKSPLYVVDGIPVLSGKYSKIMTSSDLFNLINPDDIESISVLKDAAASSLYGSRAANGVVIINTKKGKSGKAKWNVNFEYGVSDFANPNRLENFMTGSEYTDYAFTGLKNRYLHAYKQLPGTEGIDTSSDAWKAYEAKAESYAYSKLHSLGGIVHPDDDGTGTFDYNNLTDAQKNRYFTHARNSNWNDQWFQKGRTQKLNFNVRGGTNNFNYYFSLGADEQEGVIPQSTFERLSSKLSLNLKPSEKFSISYNQTLGYSLQEGQTTGAWYYANPLFAIYSANPTAPTHIPDADGKMVVNPKPAFSPKIYNPLVVNNFFERKAKNYRYLGNISATYNFTPWLALTSTNGVDFIHVDEYDFVVPEHPDAGASNGWINYYRRNIRTFTTSNLLKFKKSVFDHNFDALVGYEAMKHDKDYILATGENFASSKLMYLSNAATPKSVGQTYQEDMLLSYLAQGKYNYKNKYYLSGSFRRDGSGRLSSDNMWGNFYSVSGAWSMKNEAFLQNVDFLDLLKIRASYGTSGKLPSGLYDSQALYSVSGAYSAQPTIQLTQLENSQLTWEFSKTWNVGVDYNVFGRLGGTFEYYIKNTDGLLNDVPVSYVTGFSSMQFNKGLLRNQGLEFDINYTVLKETDLKWDININGTLMKVTIEELDEPIESFPYFYEEGLSMYSYKLREWAGVNPANGHPMWYTNSKIKDDKGNVIQPGSAYKNPLGGDRFVTSNSSHAEKTIVGDAIPDIYGGITNTFTYKGFDLSFLMTYSLGADLYNTDFSWQNSDGRNIGTYNLLNSSLDAWEKPGDRVDNPIVIYGSPLNGDYNSNRRLVNGNYLKLKNLQFGYNLPEKWAKRVKLSSARLYVNATDLFLLSHDPNFNPEVNFSGSSQSVEHFPPMRTYRFGVNLEF